MEVLPVLVAFHSVLWIRVAVESYLRQFPADQILVVDNNPRRDEPGWFPHCEEERDWLAAHPSVLLVDGSGGPQDRLADGRLEHGAAVDVAMGWCRRHGARVLLHFEPDCLISGPEWRGNLLQALADGAWMAGGFRQSHGTIHPTPTAWQVADVRASFKIRPWAEDGSRPAFHELLNMSWLETDPSPEARWIRLVRYWDTGHKAWFEAAVQGRAALAATPGFKHYWGGSLARRFSERTLAEQFPEVRPFLDLARSRKATLRVEQCPFREDARRVGGLEVATCRLAHWLSGVADPRMCEVGRDACESCCSSFRPSPRRINPPVASLLYGLAENAAMRGGIPGCTAAEAAALLRRVEGDLGFDLP